MHRVVILKDVKSDIIASAILILKNSDSACDSSVLAEAERVVARYMQNGAVMPHEKIRKKVLSPLLGMIVIAVSAICLYIVFRLIT